ncbi:hypothetical protein LguiA_025805 [Lonicera macranthoides]
MDDKESNSTSSKILVKVGVLLDTDIGIGKMSLRCIRMALSDFYASHPQYKTRLHLSVRNSNATIVGAAVTAAVEGNQPAIADLELLGWTVVCVCSEERKIRTREKRRKKKEENKSERNLINEKVQAIIGPMSSMQSSFVIDLGNHAQVPIISFSATNPFLSSLRSEYFVRATLNDSSQVQAITALIQAFGWRNVVPIYADDDLRKGIIPSLTTALNKIRTQIPYQSAIHPSVIYQEIVAELYKLMTMQTRVFILHMTHYLASRVLNKAQEVGMMTEGYVWILSDGITNPLNLMGTSLVGSLKGVIGVKPYVPRSRMLDNFTLRWEGKSSKDVNVNLYGLWAYDATIALAMAIEKVGYTNNNFKKMNSSRNSVNLGSYLHRVMSSIRFNGLSGEFHIVNGQLQQPAFEIINGIGDGERVIGFWTAKHGIEKVGIRDIIWPGEATSVPRGWVIPTNAKKLKIGIPVKDGFNDFVKFSRDPSTNSIKVTGFCIDVFEAVMATLPYAVSFEYIPFAKPDGSAASSYDELVYQVFLGNFDAVVGDVTIRANRSLYVDFTLPFTESSINMIVPVKDKKTKNAWVFLKPLTWDLWVTSFCFFIFIGLVIWILEHGINEDFNGTLPQQLGTSFWFSFSTMIFAHKEQVVSNLSRLVVIIWCFVVLILTQSYTASLTSTLTGEIGAAFDGIPHMKLFLAKHCSKYTMVGPTLKTTGFGFVFPKGLPLVPDVSRAILHVTEGEKMEKIEKAWFGKQTNCPDPSTSMSSNSLGINSFWGLFVVVGVAASFALIIFTSMIAYENKNILLRIHPKDMWKNFITSNGEGESDGTNADSVDETTGCPNLSNNKEETMCNQENQNAQTHENIVVNPSQDESICEKEHENGLLSKKEAKRTPRQEIMRITGSCQKPKTIDLVKSRSEFEKDSSYSDRYDEFVFA